MQNKIKIFKTFMILSFTCSIFQSLIFSTEFKNYENWLNGNIVDISQYEIEINDTKYSIDKIETVQNLASILKQSGDYEKAIEILEKFIDKNYSEITDFSIFRDLGTLKYYIGKTHSAEKFLNKAFEINPYDLETNFNLGKVLLDKNDFKNAIKYLENAININSEFAGSYFYLAKTYEKIFDELYYRKNTEDIRLEIAEVVKKNYLLAITKDSYFTEARFEFAKFYTKCKNYDSAFQQLTKIKNTSPNFNEANILTSEIIPFLSKEITDKLEKKTENASIIEEKSIPEFKIFSKIIPQINPYLLRIGINSDQKGFPCKTNNVCFYSNNDFKIEITLKINEIEKILTISGFKNTQYKILLENNFLSLYNSNNEILVKNANIIKIYNHKNYPENSFIIENIEIGKGFSWYNASNMQYRGDFEFSLYDQTINIINILDIEEYLYGVISSEIMYWWPNESLKAQAVLARTYALHRKKISNVHKNLGYDLCSSQHCQVYSGISSEIEIMNKAVDETKGKILKYNGNIVNGLYHSNSGGYTQPSGNVKDWNNLSYLKGSFEGYEENKIAPNSPYALENWIKTYPKSYSNDSSLKTSMATFRWIRVVKPEYIKQKIEFDEKIELGDIKDIIVLNRSKSGNINKLKIIGDKTEFILEKENQIRYYLGLNSMRSTMFWIEKKYNKETKNLIEEFIIYGGGWGHGVGMSQTGAAGMANKGFNYDEILKFYFPDTQVENL
jgi:stage II sporulation protein D